MQDTERNHAPPLPTVGWIAAALGVPVHRVNYILRTRRIEPTATAGGTRLFDQAAVARVRHEINRLDARRAAKGGGR